MLADSNGKVMDNFSKEEDRIFEEKDNLQTEGKPIKSDG